jgi:phospholipid/cholesterol/gamma-HCH transport system substrate-binding protein
MNNLQQTARVGLFFLFGGGGVFRAKGYTVIAGFESLKDVAQGDEVRMAGVKIGSVETTRLAGRRAEAVLRIDPKVEIPNDATATIVMSGLIGSDYIGVDLGTAGAAPLKDGDDIHTAVTPDINSVMSDLGDLGKKLDGALTGLNQTFNGLSQTFNGDGKTPSLFQKLDTLVTDNSAKIGTTMDNLQSITGKIDQGKGTLGLLINDRKIHDDLIGSVDQIKAVAAQAKTFIANAQAIVDKVKSGQGAIGALVYDNAAGTDIKATVTNIRLVTDNLAQSKGTLGKLINDDTILRDAQAVLKKADTALDGMGDSGPITAIGVLAQALF